jgi:hypothetical protein
MGCRVPRRAGCALATSSPRRGRSSAPASSASGGAPARTTRSVATTRNPPTQSGGRRAGKKALLHARPRPVHRERRLHHLGLADARGLRRGGAKVRGETRLQLLERTRRVQLVRRDGRDVSTLYGREEGGGGGSWSVAATMSSSDRPIHSSYSPKSPALAPPNLAPAGANTISSIERSASSYSLRQRGGRRQHSAVRAARTPHYPQEWPLC